MINSTLPDCHHNSSDKGWYWISTTYACGGIYVGECGCIIETCPYFRFILGRRFEHVIAEMHQKGYLTDYEKIDV